MASWDFAMDTIIYLEERLRGDEMSWKMRRALVDGTAAL